MQFTHISTNKFVAKIQDFFFLCLLYTKQKTPRIRYPVSQEGQSVGYQRIVFESCFFCKSKTQTQDFCIQTTPYEALSGWGSGKEYLDIVFKIQENFIIMIYNTIDMFF